MLPWSTHTHTLTHSYFIFCYEIGISSRASLWRNQENVLKEGKERTSSWGRVRWDRQTDTIGWISFIMSIKLIISGAKDGRNVASKGANRVWQLLVLILLRLGRKCHLRSQQGPRPNQQQKPRTSNTIPPGNQRHAPMCRWRSSASFQYFPRFFQFNFYFYFHWNCSIFLVYECVCVDVFLFWCWLNWAGLGSIIIK